MVLVVAVSAALAGCVTPGQNAAAGSDPVRLQQIIDQPNHGNENLDKLLWWAGIHSCVECSKILLKAGAKFTESDNLLANSAATGNTQMARLLIEHGAEPGGAIVIVRGFAGLSIAQGDAAVEMLNRLDQARAARAAAPVMVADTASTATPTPHALLTPSFHEAEHPHDYALIIGVEKYDDLPAATYAEGDAATAADFVRALGVPARNVVTLTGSHATRSGMVKQLENWLVKNTDETSTVYFYFSGHGAPDPTTGQAYLVPFDGDPQYLAETAYPLKRLYEKLGALKAKRTIVMVDSCFSGAGGRSVLAKGSRPLVNNVDTGFRSAADGKISVLTASGANQISGTNEASGHGLFTYYLFNGLNGAAKDGAGLVTLQSLYDYLKPKVMDDARRANRDQTPELESPPSAALTVLREK
jgi:uncharacterized caspase-like protein